MANCTDMKESDLYGCNSCGLELSVVKECTCEEGSEDACTKTLMCCDAEMVAK